MTKTDIKQALQNTIDHVRESTDCSCDLCRTGADTAEKVLELLPAEWFRDDADAVNQAADELSDY